MDQSFTNKYSSKKADLLRKEIQRLKCRVYQLEQQLAEIQFNCEHVFVEESFIKKCTKCHYIESIYY
ncbi:hypothetical protein [Bacillus alveayuensis]|jgi:hypothetical protein|uniref:Uncharacterized protein n=1 Tax=Aeribacillus alveayuensis TaxID=279215 RepID=A0ABT9VQ62_9BACI|nr:hypothetical protein [Bacillus alveayuensis]MDQ0163132.1 hypothetical protein [Bacillus alveayuensis]